MPPLLAGDDLRDGLLRYSIALCQLPLTDTSGTFPNPSHVRCMQFGVRPLLTPGDQFWMTPQGVVVAAWHRCQVGLSPPDTRQQPSFARGISHVLSLPSKEQMVRSAAGGLVALMEDPESGRDRPDQEFVGEAVGKHMGPAGSTKQAIAMLGVSSLPEPAAAAFPHLTPEPFFQRFHRRKV